MTDKEILREALKASGKKQADIANELGVNRATVSTNLRRDKMGVDIFLTYANVLGYTVMVGKKEKGKFVPVWELNKEEVSV